MRLILQRVDLLSAWLNREFADIFEESGEHVFELPEDDLCNLAKKRTKIEIQKR